MIGELSLCKYAWLFLPLEQLVGAFPAKSAAQGWRLRATRTEQTNHSASLLDLEMVRDNIQGFIQSFNSSNLHNGTALS